MGNTCCGGRPGKGSQTPSVHTLERKATKQYTVSTTATRGRTKSFSRMSSGFAKNKSLSRKSTSPLYSKKQQTTSSAVVEDSLPISPESAQHPLNSSPSKPKSVEKPVNPLLILHEEDSLDDCNLSLDYALESYRDCSSSQQDQILALFASDESLDGLISVSVLSGEFKDQILVLVLTSKNVLILSAFDYGTVRLRVSLRSIRLMCVNSDRSVVAVVYKPDDSTGLEHLILNCPKLEDLMKAVISVVYDETGKLLPAVTVNTLEAVISYIHHISWPVLNELNSEALARFFKVFYTSGLIGENKLLTVQCMQDTNGVEKGVQLLVSDRAIYILSYSHDVLTRIPLETVQSIEYLSPTHMCITTTDKELKFSIPTRQVQALQETITAFRKRSNTF